MSKLIRSSTSVKAIVARSDYVEIDGSFGEGGGQILRTAVSLSCIICRPIRVINIRAKRTNPGLRPQHLTAIRALSTMFDARVENLQDGAEWISFEPSGRFTSSLSKFDVGTAGSIPMILLAVVPSVALSKNEIQLEFTGGTDVRASPTIDYLRFIVQEAYRSIGLRFSIEVLKRGYYPKGGGIVRVEIEPCVRPEPLDLTHAHKFDPKIASVCSRLPKHVAERQLMSALIALEKKGLSCRNYTASLETALSPGSSVIVYASSNSGPFIGGDSIGELGKPAEVVGSEAAERFLESSQADVPVDPFLADMIVLPLALASGKSRYRVGRVTKHLETNLHVASQLVSCRHRIIPQKDGTYVVEIEG